MVILSKKSTFEFTLLHCVFLQSLYKAFIPLSKKISKFMPADNKLFLIYPNKSSEQISCAHTAVKFSIFCIMLVIPTVALYSKASVAVVCISFFVCFASMKCADMDIVREYRVLKENILNDFSIYLTKLTLYIGSGMTLYQAFMKPDYGIPEGVFKDQLNRLINAIELRTDSEDAFLELCIALPITQINAFCSIMISGFKNTEVGIKDSLKAYTSQIWLERRNNARKKAEQSAAKVVLALAIGLIGILLVLTAPAMLMLANT